VEGPAPARRRSLVPAVASRAVVPTGTKIGGYVVRAELGRGTTAVVMEAWAPGSDEPVALKIPLAGTVDDAAARARFLRGARAQEALSHPAIVAVHAVGEDARHGPWVAMTLVRGTTLSLRLDRGDLTAVVALELLEQVAGGLDAAHAAGVIHRDVKPSNVLVDGDRAWLADFGLARDADGTDTTRTGAVIGTLPYLAPELVRGGTPSAAADRYALAALAYELVVGEVVFPRPTDAAIMYAHVDEPSPPASGRRHELPPAVDPVLARGLAKSPAQRYPTAAAFVAALIGAFGEAAAMLGPPPARRSADAHTIDPRPVAPPAARERGGRARLGALGLLAAAGAASGAVAFAPSSEREPALAAAPPPVARGHVVLGSPLTAPDAAITGRDCRDRTATGSSPACTIVQTELPGRQLVVPRDGAVRAWTVRGATGELVLQILRRRDGKIFQLFRSQPTVIGDRAVHRHAVALPAEAGDVIGLAVLPGAHVGVVRHSAGARTERWTNPVGSDRGRGRRAGFEHEVQLQVDFEPGATIPPPPQVTGRAARSLPAGREVAAGDARLPDKRRVRVALVEHGGKVYVDLYRGGLRRSRSTVPDLVAGGTVVEFRPYQSPGNPSQLNVAWRNPGTSSGVYHYYGLDAESLEFYS